MGWFIEGDLLAPATPGGTSQLPLPCLDAGWHLAAAAALPCTSAMADAVGLGFAFSAVVLYSLFALPVKSFAVGDGVYFQLFMCIGIFSVGVVQWFVLCASDSGCPEYHPLSALGGAVWVLANLFLTTIVGAIGVGMTMVAWGTVEMLTGWATARFGLFGLAPQEVARPELNYAGVGLGILALLLLALTSQPSEAAPKALDDSDSGDDAPTALLLSSAAAAVNADAAAAAAVADSAEDIESEAPTQREGAPPLAQWPHWAESGYDPSVAWPPARRRAFGLCAAVVAGSLSGSTFDAPQYVVDHSGGTARLEDQLFAHFTGILLTSATVFGLYTAATRNRPWVSAPLTLPALCSGVCWGMACLCWFRANARLSIVVAFPIVTIGPGLGSLLIGALCFNEVRGLRNAALLAVASAAFVGAALCIALSAGGG